MDVAWPLMGFLRVMDGSCELGAVEWTVEYWSEVEAVEHSTSTVSCSCPARALSVGWRPLHEGKPLRGRSRTRRSTASVITSVRCHAFAVSLSPLGLGTPGTTQARTTGRRPPACLDADSERPIRYCVL
jgi:hypothetical protein